MKTVSVIIPVYNAEKYIEKCLDSLLRQTYSEFEIICVDDGSNDSSLEILRKYERQDGRISVLTQKNQCAGVARNVGMEHAEGKYLLFLDADDFFCEDMLEQAVCEAEKNQTEILVFDAWRYDDRRQEVLREPWTALNVAMFGSGVKSAAQLSDFIYSFGMPSPWNKLFLRGYIEKNGLKFQGIKRANDVFFVYAALSCADRIGILNRKLVYYRIHNSHSLQGSLDGTPEDFARALYAVRDFLIEKNLWKRFETCFYDVAAAHCVNNLGNLRSPEAFQYLYEKLGNEIIPSLQMKWCKADAGIKKAIQGKEKLLIYGAGTLASVWVRILLMAYDYRPEDLEVVITSRGNNAVKLHGVKVGELNALEEDAKQKLTVIAVSDTAMQDEIEKGLRARQFERIAKLGFQEILSFIHEKPLIKKTGGETDVEEHGGQTEMKVILFGAGTWGREALSYFGEDNVFCFCDNHVTEGTEKFVCEKRVISFHELLEIYEDYVIVIATGADFIQGISAQLDEAGIEDYLIYYVLLKNDIKADELRKRFSEEGKNQTFKSYYKMLARWTEAKLDYLKRHADTRHLKPATGALRETQKKLLTVTGEFLEYIKDLEVKPFLIFGNLLGAYRNQGFIPWDDDFDLGMMRDAYEKMMAFVKGKCPVGTRAGELWRDVTGNCMPWRELFDRYPNTFILEIHPRRTLLLRSDYSHEWKHVCDFWVFDYYKEGYDHKAHREWLAQLNRKVMEFDNDAEKVRFLKEEWGKNPMISREATGNIFPGIDNCGGYIDFTKREVDHWIPRDKIFPLKKVKFENKEFWAPNNIEYLLGLEYGDFMEFPYDVGEPIHGKCVE